MLTTILAAHGLDYSDDPGGVTCLISNRKGNVAVARSLGEVWTAAERLTGAPLDPLEPVLLDRLSRQC
jgi:hypothetical protein